MQIAGYHKRVITKHNVTKHNEKNMTTKTLERPLIMLAENLAFKKAKFIDNQYKLSIADLNSADRLDLVSQFMHITGNLDTYLQEFLNDACIYRMCAESEPFGSWDE